MQGIGHGDRVGELLTLSQCLGRELGRLGVPPEIPECCGLLSQQPGTPQISHPAIGLGFGQACQLLTVAQADSNLQQQPMGLADALRIGGTQHLPGQVLRLFGAPRPEPDRCELDLQDSPAWIGAIGVAQCVLQQFRGDVRGPVDQETGAVGQPVQFPAVHDLQGGQHQPGDPLHRGTGPDQRLGGVPVQRRPQCHRRSLVQDLLQQPVPEP